MSKTIADAADYTADGVAPEKKTGVYGLRFRCLTPLEVLAQSVGVIAPSASAATFIGVAFASAGNATWLAYALAGVGLGLVGLNVNQFARRSASPGSLYSYTTMGLGPLFGVLVGWGWLVAYVGCGIALGAAAARFMLLLIHSPTGPAWPYIAYSLGILIPWYIAYRDIKLSAKILLVLELVSVALIMLLVLVVFTKTGLKVHLPHLKLQGFTPKGFFVGLVVAIFCNIGFESSTALGEEAKNPLKTIPRAVIGACVICSAFYVLCSFAFVGAFATAGQTLDANSDILKTLADFTGMPWLGPVLTVMVLVSALGCTLGSFNAACRVLLVMGRHGVIHSSVAGAHKTHDTPHVSVTVCAAISLIVGFVCMMSLGWALPDILNNVSTMATYGFLVGFVLISVAAPVYLKKLGKLTPGASIISALAVLFMVVPIVGSFYPLPDPPIRYFPYIFTGYLAIGCIWLFVQRSLNTGVIQQIETDLEGIGIRYGTAKGALVHAEPDGVAEPEPIDTTS